MMKEIVVCNPLGEPVLAQGTSDLISQSHLMYLQHVLWHQSAATAATVHIFRVSVWD